MKSIILLCAVMFAMVACGSKKDSDEVEVVYVEEELIPYVGQEAVFVEPFRVVKGPEVKKDAEVVFLDFKELTKRQKMPLLYTEKYKIVQDMLSSATAVGIVKKEIYREVRGNNLVARYFKFYTTSKEFPVVEFQRELILSKDLTQNNYKIVVDSDGVFADMVVAE